MHPYGCNAFFFSIYCLHEADRLLAPEEPPTTTQGDLGDLQGEDDLDGDLGDPKAPIGKQFGELDDSHVLLLDRNLLHVKGLNHFGGVIEHLPLVDLDRLGLVKDLLDDDLLGGGDGCPIDPKVGGGEEGQVSHHNEDECDDEDEADDRHVVS